MKKLKIFIITLFILITCSIGSNVFAASTDKLISLGRNGYNITVTKGTTVNDIIGVLGQPKIQTVSVFGGQAYTFYTDNNYTNYLYIETAKNGKIASFGSVDPSYKIYDVNTQGYGDEYDYYNNGILHGYLFSNSGTVAGGVYYNPEALYGANNPNAKILMINSFQDTYMSNPTKYLRGISEHAVTMYNALSTNLGNKTNLEFNEDFFYINEQFKKFGTTTREYIRDMGKVTPCMKTIALAENVEISTYGYYLLSPMYWADLVKKNKTAEFGEKNQAVFYYNENTKELFACGLRADTYDKTDSVELTTDEQSKLSAGRYEYNQSKINFRKDSAIYDVVPVATSPSKLVAGKLKPSKEQGILDYVNAIRAGAGLNKLTLDRDAYTTAQYLATLMSYRWNVLNLDIEHNPSKPSGVTDEYYKIAVEDGMNYSECIGRIANLTTVENMKEHINQFIDDGTENPQIFGHRKAILTSNITKFGYGVSPNIGVTELSGYRNSDTFIEAWPSKGITFMESYTQRTKWTIQFIDKYTITNNTTVTVKCLNTNKTYEFNEEKNTNSKVFLRHMNTLTSLNNKVVLYDSGIVPQAGYVYEITVKNIQDNATKANTSYQYRSVFEYADIDNYPSKLSSIKINPPNLKKVTDMDVYYVPLNNEVNLDVTIDSNVVDKKITWISSNSDAVEVKQNGTIIAKKLTDEDVTITVGYDGSNITDQIVVRPYRKIDEVKLDKTNLTMLASSSKVTSSSLPKTSPLTITYIPTDNTEITDITWKVISYTNPNVEYDIDDPQITKYIKVTKTNNSKVVNIEAVNVEDSNNKYIVMAIVTGISGTYTGACDVTIHLPLTGVQIQTITPGVNISSGKVVNLDYNAFNNKYFKLTTMASPTNTTDSTDVTWSTGDANIVSNYDNNGQFKIEKEGSTTITAKSTANNSISDTITFNVNATLTKLSLSGTSNIYIKSGETKTDQSGETKTDQLRLTRVPDIDNDPIDYSSNKEEIATVGTDGLVEFKKPGDVTITARSKTVPSVSAIFTYKVYLYVDDFRFSGLGQIQELQVGDKCTHTPTFEPSDASFKDKVTYSSNNPSVASVNSKTGEVTAISPGQAVIKATIAGNYVSSNRQIVREYTVKVVAPLTGVNLPATKKMVINSSYTFSPELLPKNTTDTCSYKYESDRTDIVEINQTTGVAKAKQLGKANIKVTVTTNRGTQFTASTEVEVINYLPGDVDLSSKVDAVDAALVLTLFKNHNATELNIAIGDVDSSGVLDAVDAMQILTMYKNNVYGQ